MKIDARRGSILIGHEGTRIGADEDASRGTQEVNDAG
jgi:hypothetical protein